MNGNSMMSIGMLVVIIAIMYFLLIRPQKKREKEINAMRNSINAGDQVVTIGGICGKVVKTREDSLVLQVAPGVKIEVMRWSISKVVEPAKGGDVADTADKKPSRPKRMKAVEEAPAAEEVVEEVEAEIVEEEIEE